MCAVGQALVDIELASDTPETPKSIDSAPTTATSPIESTTEPISVVHADDSAKALATPAVRRIAAENKVSVFHVFLISISEKVICS